MGRLSGRWSLVTGSARGIGRQIAIGLAREGSNVIVHGRTVEHTRGTLAMLEPYGVTTSAVGGDLARADDLEGLVRKVLDAHGGVDILYNNAGIQGERRAAWDAPFDEWTEVLQVNVVAMALLSVAFSRGMRERGWGRIVNLSSGIKDAPDLAPYSTSKTAVIKLTQELAFGLRGTGVLVNHLDPGWLRTDMAGPDAPFEVETVLPGAIVPALLDDDGPTGTGFRAQEYRGKRV